jgi:hypothetical protein
MDGRVSELLGGFEKYVGVFAASARFTGPSGYFHRKALARRALHPTVAALVEDDAFFDALYATLTAWGLHRMGPGNTKLRDLGEIRDSVRVQVDTLDKLAVLNITTVSEAETASVIDRVWSVLTALRVSVAAAQIVANSKALHHLLPALVPPMDREYTYRFFYDRTMLSIDERTAFSEMFTRMLGVARANGSVIRSAVDAVWNTGPAKVVDNAIVGYLITDALFAIERAALVRGRDQARDRAHLSSILQCAPSEQLHHEQPGGVLADSTQLQ